MSPAATPSSRQAALLLHAMCVEDRAWILRSLPQAQRMPLQVMVAELQELGIPAEPGLLAQATQGQSAAVDRPAHTAECLKNLDASRIESLARLLRGEPAMLVARLLRMQAWPWQTAVLTRLGGVQRQHVQDALRQMDAGGAAPVPSAFQGVMLRGIHQRMEAGEAHP